VSVSVGASVTAAMLPWVARASLWVAGVSPLAVGVSPLVVGVLKWVIAVLPWLVLVSPSAVGGQRSVQPSAQGQSSSDTRRGQ
jgi:hypothetical protein